MPYADQVFPDEVSQAAEGGPTFQTDCVTTERGLGWRNAQKWPRRHFSVSSGMVCDGTWVNAEAFYRSMQGRFMAFRFRDPTDYWIDSQILNINTQPYTVAKVYTIGPGVTYVRQINFFRPGTITVQVKYGAGAWQSVPITAVSADPGLPIYNTFDYNGGTLATPDFIYINYKDGLIWWGANVPSFPVPNPATDQVMFGGSFDILVRFDDDTGGATMPAPSAHTPRFTFYEVFPDEL